MKDEIPKGRRADMVVIDDLKTDFFDSWHNLSRNHWAESKSLTRADLEREYIRMPPTKIHRFRCYHCMKDYSQFTPPAHCPDCKSYICVDCLAEMRRLGGLKTGCEWKEEGGMSTHGYNCELCKAMVHRERVLQCSKCSRLLCEDHARMTGSEVICINCLAGPHWNPSFRLYEDGSVFEQACINSPWRRDWSSRGFDFWRRAADKLFGGSLLTASNTEGEKMEKGKVYTLQDTRQLLKLHCGDQVSMKMEEGVGPASSNVQLAFPTGTPTVPATQEWVDDLDRIIGMLKEGRAFLLGQVKEQKDRDEEKKKASEPPPQK